VPSLAAAFGALVWPGVTAMVPTVWVAAWAFVTGIVEVALSFRGGESAGDRTIPASLLTELSLRLSSLVSDLSARSASTANR